MIQTTPCVTGRSFENTIGLAVQQASETGNSVMMVFDDVAVQIDPGDGVVAASRHFHHTEQQVLSRMSRQPLLADRVRRVAVGDIVETLEDDHFTKVRAGSAGIVTDVAETEGVIEQIVVRFARRTVDYQPADFGHLRYVR